MIRLRGKVGGLDGMAAWRATGRAGPRWSRLTGSVVIETIFGIPGVGRYYVDSFNLRDYPVAQAVNLVLACAVVLINVVVDVSYGLIDPRIRRA